MYDNIKKFSDYSFDFLLFIRNFVKYITNRNIECAKLFDIIYHNKTMLYLNKKGEAIYNTLSCRNTHFLLPSLPS